MASCKALINLKNLPQHIAIIMDGNGRWAEQHGKPRAFGHLHGVETVHTITEAAAELGIEYLTLYAFSTENWNRPAAEVAGLMDLLVSTIEKETQTLQKNNVRLLTIGATHQLPQPVADRLQTCINQTAGNTGLSLVLALSYSSRWEIEQLCRQIAAEAAAGNLKAEDIHEQTLRERLATVNIPDPELLIRTSGEYRLSNFLLWQIAYTELYFTPTLWPDFNQEDLYAAILDYQQRERRFGKTSAQLTEL